MTNIDAQKQMTSALQKNLNDVNEIEQQNRDYQVELGFNHLIGSSKGKNIMMSGASTAQQQNTNTQVKYLTNSNVPSRYNVPLTQELTQNQINYTTTTDNVDVQKEAAIQSVGPKVFDFKLPSSVKNTFRKTEITNQPIVDDKTKQVIISQEIKNDPATGKEELVETAINTDAIQKTEQFIKIFPNKFISEEQRAAINYFFTLIWVYRFAGQ